MNLRDIADPEKARCREVDAEMWFVEGEGSADIARRAKAICNTCPLAAPCLEAALHLSPAVYGIWAGTTFEQRRVMRQKRGIQLSNQPAWKEFLAS